MEIFRNPLETVQIVPIFNYLTLLSNFLYSERYITEGNQTRPIPIVNGLYEYLKVNEQNNLKKSILIRNLLKGSDLYGAKESEYFDITFVNAMFDHIITSLVFEKYGNIYGFLATIFLRANNLHVDKILQTIFLTLEMERFENEYGEKSKLDSLALGRIYNDIILPMFPIAPNNLTLLSLDYIYAQAGSMFLQAGFTQPVYYSDRDITSNNNKVLFDEYLQVGHIIEKLIQNDEKNAEMSKAFALPALTFYIKTSNYLFEYENMANVVSYSHFWQGAYSNLFQHTIQSLNEIETELKNDYKYQMHLEIYSFQNCVKLAKTVLKNNCPTISNLEHKTRLDFYLNFPKSFYCGDNIRLPDPEENFMKQINEIGELFKIYYSQLIEDVIVEFQCDDAIVSLPLPDNRNDPDNSSETHSYYNLLESYCPNTKSSVYYVLNHENDKITLKRIDDESSVFTEETLSYFHQLTKGAMPKMLKTSDETIAIFWENLINFKKAQFMDQLQFLDNCRKNGSELNSDWWKEFGLSLLPHSPCLTNNYKANFSELCTPDVRKLFYKHADNISPKMISNNMLTVLNSLETSIKSILLRDASIEAVNDIVTENKLTPSLTEALKNRTIFKDIATNIKYSAFRLTFVDNETIGLLRQIIGKLKQKTPFSFVSVLSSLSRIMQLKSNHYRGFGTIGEKNKRLMFVNTLNTNSDTGYGYKFIFLSSNISEIAVFRTAHDLKDERLLVQIESTEREGRMFTVLDNITFVPNSNHHLYEINNELRRRSTKAVFAGISINLDDCNERCADYVYFYQLENENKCQRIRRLKMKLDYEYEISEQFVNETNFRKNWLRSVLQFYTFPDKSSLVSFIKNCHEFDLNDMPVICEEYLIPGPQLLNDLRYHAFFEKIISKFDGKFRISSFYSMEERSRIEENDIIEDIIDSFNAEKARFSVSFHDYYAIRNFATSGYKRITSDTNEARLMKLALYKLAIRQSDDPVETFDLKLFRVETKPTAVIDLLSPEKYITLQKFTQAYPLLDSATRFFGYPLDGYTNIVYEILFDGPYLRAKIEQFYRNKETMVVLLPGSLFYIEERTKVDLGGLGSVYKIKLKYSHASFKYTWYKKIMEKIVDFGI